MHVCSATSFCSTYIPFHHVSQMCSSLLCNMPSKHRRLSKVRGECAVKSKKPHGAQTSSQTESQVMLLAHISCFQKASRVHTHAITSTELSSESPEHVQQTQPAASRKDTENILHSCVFQKRCKSTLIKKKKKACNSLYIQLVCIKKCFIPGIMHFCVWYLKMFENTDSF